MINNEGANYIINTLEKKGYSAYYVGGCVRNALLGEPIYDYDICTSARPEIVKEVFSGHKLLTNGIKHGTVTIIINDAPYEVTTFRKESSYSDFRHPDIVEFTTEIKEDLARRDFTINAMAYNKNQGIIDDFGGVYDTRNRVLKTVNDPLLRFYEDGLRILRGLRFASVYNLTVETKTAFAMIERRSLLSSVSAERIYSELNKLLLGSNVSIVLFQFSKVLFQIIPELECDFDYQWLFNKVQNTPSNLVLKYATLLLPCKNNCQTVFKRLKFDNETKNGVVLFHSLSQFSSFESLPDLKRLMNALDEKIFDYLNWRLALCDDLQLKNEINGAILNCQKIISENQCYTIKQLAINGNDLLSYGVSGSNIKKMLNFALEGVICQKVKNEKIKLLKYLELYG